MHRGGLFGAGLLLVFRLETQVTLESPSRQSALLKATLMTTEVAKPEGEHVDPFRPGQAKRHVGGANRLLRLLGPGLVTGASDDDPSGIGTYSQVGAQFGHGLLWTMHLFSGPRF
jgi:hypothetical protein